MAYFKIAEPNKNPKWIKNIDRANGTLEFSENRDGCFQQDSGFFADSELAYLKFHFTEAYPELQYMTIDTSWRTNQNNMADEGHWEEVAVPQAPIDPQPINQIEYAVDVANPVMEAREAAVEAEWADEAIPRGEG